MSLDAAPTGILVPRKVFLDTGHLIELSKIVIGDTQHLQRQPAEVTAARRRILQAIRYGLVIPVIGFDQPYEWIKNGVEEGREIAQVLDQAPTCYEVAHNAPVFVLEAVAEAIRFLGCGDVRLPAVMHRVNEPDEVTVFLREHIPGARKEHERSGLAALQAHYSRQGIDLGDRAFRSARNLVEIAAKVRIEQSQMDEQSRVAFKIGFWQTQDNMGAEQSDPKAAVIARLRRAELVPAILGSLGLPDSGWWDQLDMANCPALDLWSRFWWHYVKNQGKPEEHDAMDVAFLPAYCYADFALTERRMRSHICSADHRFEERVFAKATALLAAMGL